MRNYSMTNHNKAAGEHLTKAHRKIGIKAVAAAVEVNKQKGGFAEAQTDKAHQQQRMLLGARSKVIHQLLLAYAS